MFSLCLGSKHWGGEGETGGIDINNWTNDDEDIDAIRSMCQEQCVNESNGAGNCLQSPDKKWQIKNHEKMAVPDPLMLIDNPAEITCKVPKDKRARNPAKTKVIPPTSTPKWPSTDQPLALSCGDFETCANEFPTPIGPSLYYNDAETPWGPGMGGADHQFTTSLAGHSSLAITLANPRSTPSFDAGALDYGEVEYSAPNCGELECPFYLANLTISNHSNVWQLYSHDLLDDVYISDVTVALRRPTLGVWNTATGELYLGEERLDLIVTGTLQIGEGSPLNETYFVTNSAAIFGQIGLDGAVEIFDVQVDDREFSLEATLDYDAPASLAF
ncbi:hypothetical protein [Enhygromyxa salina]|nr:hypothetical protein [Enhygromyxa salina]